MKPNSLQLLIVLSVTICMAAGALSSPVKAVSLAAPAQVASR
jgi:hypothetical protein